MCLQNSARSHPEGFHKVYSGSSQMKFEDIIWQHTMCLQNSAKTNLNDLYKVYPGGSQIKLILWALH